jgi:hypothetical protein
MRVIAARSKFFYQRQQTIQPESVLPQLDSYCVVGPGGRMPLFVNLFYGNGGTKFPQRLPGARGYDQASLISTKILGIFDGTLVDVGILNKVRISYTILSKK